MQTKNQVVIKNTVISIFIAIILLLILNYYFIFNAKQDLYDEKSVFLSEISSKNAMLVKTKIEDLMSQIESLAIVIGNEDNMDDAILNLTNQVEKNEFKRMGIIDLYGQATTTDNLKFDFSERAYFKAAIEGKSNVSDRLIDKADQIYINVFATPVYHDKEIIGVLFGTKNTCDMAEFLDVQSFDGEGYSYIINSDGSTVSYNENGYSDMPYENLFNEIKIVDSNKENLYTLMEEVENSRNGITSFVRNGVKNQIGYSKVGINDWYMITSVPAHVIDNKSNKLISQIVIIMGLILVIIIFLSMFIINRFKSNSEELKKIAFFDEVTGHYNWKKFRIECEKVLKNKSTKNYAMIALDIDKFKIINDIYGYKKGNEILKHIALSIETNINKGECFSRVSTDNYSILIEYKNTNEIISKINKITSQVTNYIKGYHIELSFGICIIDNNFLSTTMLYDRAHIARHTVKNRADINYAFYNKDIRDLLLEEKEIENYMIAALEKKEFEVYLQPKYSLQCDEIISAEALVRWNHPKKGMIKPDKFIPIFENNGFIKKLDFYMFEQVCIILNKWKSCKFELNQITISVNISRINLNNRNLPYELLDIANKYNIESKYIEIELTESAIFEDASKIILIVKAFRDLGFIISIDDFGSGYSALNILKDLPVDIIKLDREFLNKITNTARGKVIVSSLINMIKTLAISTVAEGVETVEQIQFLKECGCDIAQGYYYSKPIQVDSFEKLLKTEIATNN
ncbi:MAG: EAL domain-containing protein [Clostridium sp.]